MSGEKTPRELLRESLLRNAEELKGWPSWMHSAISTESIFSVPSPTEAAGRVERHEVSPVTQSTSEE
jgi:hypothetical protein